MGARDTAGLVKPGRRERPPRAERWVCPRGAGGVPAPSPGRCLAGRGRAWRRVRRWETRGARTRRSLGPKGPSAVFPPSQPSCSPVCPPSWGQCWHQSTMFLVGLSGGIASGKSTVVATLRELGCAVIDADLIARDVVQPHSKAHQQILQHFGSGILLENGEINREALGNIIFSQPEKRRLLNSITHPEILKEMLKQILKYFVLGYRYVILDIPLLFETRGLTKFMKYTVLVYCDPPAQRARLMRRNGLDAAAADARIGAQLPLEEKRQWATHVIDNSGDRESTRRQVLRLHARLEDSLDFLWARLVAGAALAGLGGLLFLLLRHFSS
ncbi:dephospho-CoA kinase domain-containing protein isoform X1 [Pithys albifrons albifrons]|uniref:dephospho-CoA kinase domain-containing protein isoform X1 n=2 Tax=Pithys albifrons albifrons TaxID=3385563 RepID=UPI003A5CF883